MWNKVKRALCMFFDRYSQYVAGVLYVLTAAHEYWMEAFELFQFVTYGGIPIFIFLIFYLQGMKRGRERADFDMLTSQFKEFHEHVMRQIFQHNSQIDHENRAQKEEIH